MGLARHVVYCLLVVGCSYNPSPGPSATGDDGPVPGDGVSPDGTVVQNDAPPDSQVILPALVDRGLVLRYFMDEAASGTTPSNLDDSASNPLDLPITYGQATYVETGGNRGLTWGASQGSGKAELSFGATKLFNELRPAATVTIEVVAQINNAGPAGNGNESQITGLRGGNPDFALTAIGSTDLRFFRPFGSEGATWNGVNNQQRMVLHLVFDSTKGDPQQRIELFKNGALVAKNTSSPPNPNQTVGLGSTDELMIGNRQQADRSIQGTIFYVAYYKVALDTTEIGNNVQRLMVDDDKPSD